jgi:Glyoxalase-like domain
MAVAQGVFVTLDCAEPQALGEFWAAILGGEVKSTSPTTVMVRTDWMWVAALQVEDYVPPTWPSNEVPKQIHLDLGVTDLEAAVAEAQQLGAAVAPVQPGADRWRVLFDPAGHPFCFTTLIPAEALQP